MKIAEVLLDRLDEQADQIPNIFLDRAGLVDDGRKRMGDPVFVMRSFPKLFTERAG